MKNYFFISFLFLSSVLFAQNKFNVNVGSGILSVKKEAGANFGFGASYDIGARTGVYGAYDYSNIQLDKDNNSNLNRFQLGGYYKLLNKSTQISSLFGFSALNSNNELLIDKKTTLAMDVGVLVLFNADNKFNYGIKWVNSFSPSSIGGIMQTGVYFNYKL